MIVSASGHKETISLAVVRFILQRLVVTAVMLSLVSASVFLVAEALPGDISRLMLGQFATQQDITLVHTQLGLDRSFLVRYLDWAASFLSGNWGESWRLRVPLAPLVMSRLENSAILAGLTLLVTVPISILCGVLASLKRDGIFDRLVLLLGMCGMAVPEFVSSMFLILGFSLWLGILPASSRVPEGESFLLHLNLLILPAAALGFVLFG
jgi:peptide/nickel transport system permease protein